MKSITFDDLSKIIDDLESGWDINHKADLDYNEVKMDEYDSDDYVDLDESDFIDGATGTFPFTFTEPKSLAKGLVKDSKFSGSDQTGSYKKNLWAKLWTNVRPDELDPAQAAADYYLLFGLANNSFVEFPEVSYPSIADIKTAGEILGESQSAIDAQVAIAEDKIRNDPHFKLTEISKAANSYYVDFVNDLDKCFKEYVHLACGGELRHHQACRDSMGAYRRGAWVKWYYIFEQNGPESLLKMADLFDEFGGGSYGGPPWANAARILYQREMGELGPDEFTNKQLFVDRVFTLEHNGGCFLNKLDWVNKRTDREYKYTLHFGEMKDTVLNAHAANPTNLDSLIGHASQEVIDMVTSYLTIADQHGIEITGEWEGKSVKEDSTEASNVIPINSKKKTSSSIDWSDLESAAHEVGQAASKNDDLISKLESSLTSFKEKNKEQGKSLQDKLLDGDYYFNDEINKVKWDDINIVKWS